MDMSKADVGEASASPTPIPVGYEPRYVKAMDAFGSRRSPLSTAREDNKPAIELTKACIESLLCLSAHWLDAIELGLTNINLIAWVTRK